MPWKETGPVHERMRFIEAYLSGFYTITELASRCGISRRIAHKWLSRHDANGAAGLQDRSRAPINIPRFFWHASMSARNASMAERHRSAQPKTTSRRRLSLLAIDDTAR